MATQQTRRTRDLHTASRGKTSGGKGNPRTGTVRPSGTEQHTKKTRVATQFGARTQGAGNEIDRKSRPAHGSEGRRPRRKRKIKTEAESGDRDTSLPSGPSGRSQIHRRAQINHAGNEILLLTQRTKQNKHHVRESVTAK
jgi:hypothetical protein